MSLQVGNNIHCIMKTRLKTAPTDLNATHGFTEFQPLVKIIIFIVFQAPKVTGSPIDNSFLVI